MMLTLLLALATGQALVGPVPGVQLQDEGTSQGQITRMNFAGAGVSCAKSGATGTCTINGGTGSANVVEKSVALSGGAGYFSATITGQAWVTASSVIVCGVLGTTADGLTPEVIAVAGLHVVPANRVAGIGFDVLIYSPNGLDGTIRVHCTGA